MSLAAVDVDDVILGLPRRARASAPTRSSSDSATTSRRRWPTPSSCSGSSSTCSTTRIRYAPAGDARCASSASDLRRTASRSAIADHGPGISAERRDEVFVPFQRLGDTDNTTGLGLGLALSKGFTEGMGGTLDADDTPGGGLTMVVSLPARRTTGGHRMKILIADDDPQIIRALEGHAGGERLRGRHRRRRRRRPRRRPSRTTPTS